MEILFSNNYLFSHKYKLHIKYEFRSFIICGMSLTQSCVIKILKVMPII